MKIEGFFASMKTAKETVQKLKGMGFQAVSDINEHYREDRDVQTNLAGTGSGLSYSGLTLNSDGHALSGDQAPADAASPMASGYGHFEEIADVNCKVIAEVEEKDAEIVKQVLKEMGGDLEGPNFKKPRIDNQDYLLYQVLGRNKDFIDRNGT